MFCKVKKKKGLEIICFAFKCRWLRKITRTLKNILRFLLDAVAVSRAKVTR